MRRFRKTVFTIALLVMWVSSAPTFAYDAAEPGPAALDRLKTVDCETQQEECRYFAVVETLAFAEACPVAFSRKFGRDDGTYVPQVTSWVRTWSALQPEELRAAALDPKNKLRNYLAQQVEDYLSTLPADDLGIECSRIAIIKEGKLPDDKSDVLRLTRNYEAWRSGQKFDSTK